MSYIRIPGLREDGQVRSEPLAVVRDNHYNGDEMGPHRRPPEQPEQPAVHVAAAGSCPLCGDTFRALRLGGQSFDKCGDCGAIWIGRETILALRGKRLAEHPLLQSANDGNRSRFDELTCPSCRAQMGVFDYRGGSVSVDQCKACDHFLLDPGELSQILKEWDEGFELSETAKFAMMDHHIQQATENDGPGWTLLAVTLVAAGWIAMRFVGVLEGAGIGDGITYAVVFFLITIAGVLYWRRLQAQRRAKHRVHVRKFAAMASADDVQAAKAQVTAKPAKSPQLPKTPAVVPDGAKAFPKPGAD